MTISFNLCIVVVFLAFQHCTTAQLHIIIWL